MNFLNRKMFQAGGSANVDEKYFFIDKINKTKKYIDPVKLYNDLSRSDAFTITSFVQNPDVTYSPATEDILRQIVYEKQSGPSSVDPNTFQFGTQLPDYLTGMAGVRDVAGSIGQGAVGLVEGALNLGQKYSLGLGEGGKQRLEEGFVPRDILPGGIGSERMPFSTETITGALSDTDPLGVYDRGGMLRQGIPQATLVDALSRSGVGDVITDFSAEIDEIKAPTPEIAGEDITDRSAFDFRDEDMRSKVSQSEYDKELARRQAEIEADPLSQTLGVAEFDVDARRKAFEEAMEGRDEFGELIPTDRPPTAIDPIKAEIDKTLQEILPAEIKVDVDKTEADSLREMAEKMNDPSGLFAIDPKTGDTVGSTLEGTMSVSPFLPTPELMKVDTNVTAEDRNTARSSSVPKETTGLFGSDRFLDFIRNVGSGLVATGQMGEGLAVGAAKAAEERAARELLEEQEKKKFDREMKIAMAKAIASKKPESLNAKQTIDFANEIKRDISDFEGGLAATGFTDYAIEIIEEAKEKNEAVGGLRGFLSKMVDKGFAFAGAPRDFENMSADSKVEALLKVVKQKNLQAILGESGRTISDKDRQIIEEVFGSLGIFESTDAVLGKLYESRRGLAQANSERKSRIQDNLPYLRTYGTDGETFYIQSLPSLKRVLGIDPFLSQADIARAQFGGDAIPGFTNNTGITDIDY